MSSEFDSLCQSSFVCGQDTNSVLNNPETGHGLPTLDADGNAIKNDGTPLGYRLGTSNVAPLTIGGQINPALAANKIQVIKDTHGKTSHLSASDFDALIAYLKSLEKSPNP
jgi:hypothetical protein